MGWLFKSLIGRVLGNINRVVTVWFSNHHRHLAMVKNRALLIFNIVARFACLLQPYSSLF